MANQLGGALGQPMAGTDEGGMASPPISHWGTRAGGRRGDRRPLGHGLPWPHPPGLIAPPWPSDRQAGPTGGALPRIGGRQDASPTRARQAFRSCEAPPAGPGGGRRLSDGHLRRRPRLLRLRPGRAAALRADERQSRCLRLARCIYLHAAKIRVLYRRYLDRSLPSATPSRSGPASATAPALVAGQSEGSADEGGAQPHRARGPKCRGPLCVARLLSGGAAFPVVTKARGGPGSFDRCRRCRDAERRQYAVDLVRDHTVVVPTGSGQEVRALR